MGGAFSQGVEFLELVDKDQQTPFSLSGSVAQPGGKKARFLFDARYQRRLMFRIFGKNRRQGVEWLPARTQIYHLPAFLSRF